MATLKLFFTRVIILLRTCLFSLRERASRRRNSIVHTPTIILIRTSTPPSHRLEPGSYLIEDKGFNDVSLLDILIAPQPNTAFESCCHFLDIFFHASE